MKLTSAEIQNFRCVEHTRPFSIYQTACLVGKNESGKTTILQALERLNPYDENRKKYDKLQDYPRRYYSDYASRHPDGEAVVLTTKWRLDPEDKKLMEEEFGPGCLMGEEVEIRKHYEEAGQTGQVPIDTGKIILTVRLFWKLIRGF